VHPDPASLDHRLKFRRAFDHLQQFKGAEDTWVQGDSHTVRSEHDPKTRDMTFYATVTKQPGREPFSVQIGDFLHNLRSCLDLLAYELAVSYTKPLPKEIAEKSEFPIFGDVDGKGRTGTGTTRFRDNGCTKIQGWDPAAQTIVEELQPYKRGNVYADDPLWVLHELDRINKHRLLHAVAAGNVGIGMRVEPGITNAIFGPGVVESMGSLVDTDTPVARFPNVRASDPSREVHMEITPALCVAFADTTPCVASEPVYKTLTDLYFYVGSTVFDALEPFLN
jgi:hypothetical protein